MTAVNGMATFPGLTLSQAGTGYVFTFTSAGLTTDHDALQCHGRVGHAARGHDPAAELSSPNNGFGLVVTAESPLGLVDPTFNGTVTLGLNQNPGNAQLPGCRA